MNLSMIKIETQKNITKTEISIANVILLLSVLTIPMLILTVHFLSVFFTLGLKYDYYEVGTTYFFNLNIFDNYLHIMLIVHSFLIINFLVIFILLLFKMTKNRFTLPSNMRINGFKIAILLLLIVVVLIFLLYHNVAQLNELTKAIQNIHQSSEVANISYLGIQLPTNIALIDYFLIPAIIVIIIIIILVFIKK